MKNIVIAVAAHVDAGKTTLCEALLYRCGKIRKLGRVDNKDCFFDSSRLEKSRGITIHAHSASFEYGGSFITLLDTPGHSDFYSETERTLSAADYAVLVISGTDSIQSQTVSLWKTLKALDIPVIVFVSKMDISYKSRDEILSDLSSGLEGSFLDFTDGLPDEDDIAMSGEALMDSYLSEGRISDGDISDAIGRREIFPCIFGSGLKSMGIESLLELADRFCAARTPDDELSGRIFKITHDSRLGRLAWIRLYGGSVSVRDTVVCNTENYSGSGAKINGIFMLSGAKYEAVPSCDAGRVCAVSGLADAVPGCGIGILPYCDISRTQAFMNYRLILAPDTDVRYAAARLAEFGAEEPSLRLKAGESAYIYSVDLLGEVQRETLLDIIKDRFDLSAATDAGKVLYLETVNNTVEGIGHFEPLRHYAEVHILIEPLPRGSGIEYRSVCSEDFLDRNWQRLIMTNLAEKQHIGVLTGSPLTDVRYTLVSGKAHIKHTEGGDFREAVYRAVRMGLMSAESVLLEPYCSFSFEFPAVYLSRIINDIKNIGGTCDSPEQSANSVRLSGSAPVSGMNGYIAELKNYTRGKCVISLSPAGYRECSDSEAVVSAMAYDPDRDTDNPSDSVFCSHGAGTSVSWKDVRKYMHLPEYLNSKPDAPASETYRRSLSVDDAELEEIMLREFGPVKRPVYSEMRVNSAAENEKNKYEPHQEYIIVDGYNFLYAVPEFRQYVTDNPDLARTLLSRKLSDYASFTGKQVVVVYDAYGGTVSEDRKFTENNINTVYTQQGETADAYIQKLSDSIGRNYNIRVVTDDSLIRLSAFGSGVLRMSTSAFDAELNEVSDRISRIIKG